MLVSEFDYALPPELIAQHPAPHRTASRLLHLDAASGALRDLVQQLLTESEEEIAAWRERIRDAVEPNGQLIVDVVPELQLIIGPQPRVPELEALEAQNRFYLAFQNVEPTGKRMMLAVDISGSMYGAQCQGSPQITAGMGAAAIASLFVHSLRARLALGWALGALVSAAGLWASWAFDLPTGATLVSAFGAAIALAASGIGAASAAKAVRAQGPAALRPAGAVIGGLAALAGAVGGPAFVTDPGMAAAIDARWMTD